MAEEGSKVVLADSARSMARFLRPFKGFQAVYQGQPATIPVAFPGDIDAIAAKGAPGYDPNLLAGLSVPMGARIVIWIPLTLAGYTVNPNYFYDVVFRLRNERDYNFGISQNLNNNTQTYGSYHLSLAQLGQPQATGTDRYFIPGVTNTIEVVQAEPTDNTPVVVDLRAARLNPLLDPVWTQPLTPSGNSGLWQQGVYVNSTHENTSGPSWLKYELVAPGDEMSILAYKKAGTEWDFTTSGPTGDLAFSNTFGNSNGQNPATNTAIIVFTGTV